MSSVGAPILAIASRSSSAANMNCHSAATLAAERTALSRAVSGICCQAFGPAQYVTKAWAAAASLPSLTSAT